MVETAVKLVETGIQLSEVFSILEEKGKIILKPNSFNMLQLILLHYHHSALTSLGFSLLCAAVILIKLDLITWGLKELLSDSDSNNFTAKKYIFIILIHCPCFIHVHYPCLQSSPFLQNGKFQIFAGNRKISSLHGGKNSQINFTAVSIHPKVIFFMIKLFLLFVISILQLITLPGIWSNMNKEALLCTES